MDNPILLKCSDCGSLKPEDGFTRRKNRTRGRLNKCKACSAEDLRKQRKENPLYYITKKWGLSPEEFDEKMLNQGGECAICREGFKESPNIDHDHVTGKVRGLLCMACNFGLGFFKDSSALLFRADDYLKRYTKYE